ncbi:hypothetical protein ACFL59_13460 [Planctomycetota bacterium]
MKALSYLLAVVGVALLVCAVVGRFVGEPTVFGHVRPFNPKTVVLGANSVLLMAILARLYGGGGKGAKD